MALQISQCWSYQRASRGLVRVIPWSSRPCNRFETRGPLANMHIIGELHGACGAIGYPLLELPYQSN